MSFFAKITREDGSESHYYYSRVNDEDIKEMKLGNEGQEIKFFSLDEVVNLPLTKSLKKYMHTFMDKIKSLVES